MFLRHLLPIPVILLLSLATLPAQAVQTCPAGNDLVTPNTDLVDNADSTVTHTRTGLMWKQCSEGFSGALCGTGSASVLSWVQAQGAALIANAENFAGYSDWRLPNKNELQSIAETGCYNPAINATRFLGTAATPYWTSTTLIGDPTRAWLVDFYDGFSSGGNKPAGLYVRLVRGGQSGAFDNLISGCTLDVDGNGAQDALTDGLLIIRALFGLTGTAVTSGAIGSGSPMRTTWAQIQPYLNGKCGANFAP